MHLNLPIVQILKNRNYRLLWSAGAFSYSGEVSELLVSGWLVLQITGDPLQVALVGVSRTVALFTFTLIAGAVGDRQDRRHIMLGAYLVNILVLSGILLVLTVGNVEPWHIFLAIAIKGASRSFDNTNRRALMYSVVGPRHVVQAISMETLGFSTGKIMGALVIGALLQADGTAIGAYSFLTALYAASLTCMVFVKVTSTTPTLPRRPVLGSVGEGLRYAVSTPPIAAVLVATVVMNAMFQFQLFIPVVAQEHLHVGPGLMGLLASADGIGIVTGSVLMGLLGGRIKNHGRVFLVGSLTLTAFLLGFALSPWYVLSFFLLVSLGVAMVGFGAMQSSIILMATPPSFHSRSFGVMGLAIGAGQLGNLEMGVLASAYGVSLALGANAVVGIALLLLIAILMPALRRPIQRVQEESAKESQSGPQLEGAGNG